MKMSNKRVAAGTVKFSSSNFSDKHISDVLDHIAAAKTIDRQELVDYIQKKINKVKDIAKKAPLLYSTIELNLIESEVFNFLEDHKISVDGAPKFSKQVFDKLLNRVKMEHPKFFPMRNMIDHKTLFNMRIILVPGIDKKFADVDTAAATPKGEFIFNTNFMQHLLDYAHLKGITPKGKKYANNGGPFPPEYAYIEFLIIHEFLHYTQADFHYQKILKANPKIINWVGDFRSNYELVKNGFEQLPMGLFNDHINRDRQHTYKDMYDLVKAEFDKLNEKEQNDLSEILDSMGDDHNTPQDHNDEDHDVSPDEAWEAAEEAAKDAEDSLGDNKRDEEAEEKRKEDKGDKGSDGSGGQNNGGQGKSGGQQQEFDYKSIQPKLSWDRILRMLISSSDVREHETYQKVNKRNASGMSIAAQTGVSTVKPGIKTTSYNTVKLVFVVDESGSMSSAIAKCYANISGLFKRNKELAEVSFVLIKFSGDYEYYIGNAKRNKAIKFDSVEDVKRLEKKNSNGEALDVIFNRAVVGATNFSTALMNDLHKLAQLEYNIVIFTDSDVINDSGNYENFHQLFKSIKSQMFVIFASESDFHSAVNKMKTVPKNFTYVDKD